MHIDRPSVVATGVDVVAVDIRAELLQVVSRQIERVVRFGRRQYVRDDDEAFGLEMIETRLRPGRESGHMNVFGDQLAFDH